MREQPQQLKDLARTRLRLSRESAGKSPQEVASLAGMNLPSYFDCEHHDDLVEVISIKEVLALCAVLNIKPITLFSDRIISESQLLSVDALVAKIRQHLQQNEITVAELEEKFGFRIAPALEYPDQIWGWSIDWLQGLCNEVGISWEAVLHSAAM